MKKVLSLVLVVVMICSTFAGLQITSHALSSSGSCGDNVSYKFNYSTGLLTISGSGAMRSYTYDDWNCPFCCQTGIKTVVIESGVTSIGGSAFDGCSSLTSITIPNSVTSIGWYAFSGCSSLTSISLPDSVWYIGKHAFSGCSGLASATIPNSVTSIDEYTFFGCSSLKSVSIPNSVTSIDRFAFSDSGLTNVTIPKSVEFIDQLAFDSDSFNSIIVNKNNPNYDSRNNCNAIIETSTNTLIKGCKNTKIPNTVTNIADYAFRNCSGLTSITIPASVTSIGYNVFSGCSSLKTAGPIGSGCDYEFGWTSTIPSNAFDECSNLTSVTIPNSVTSIGESAFSFCSGLTSITIPDSVMNIGRQAFWCCSSLTSIIIPNSVTSIGEDAFYDCGVIIYEGSATGSPWGAQSVIVRDGYFIFADNQKSQLLKYTANTASVTIPNSVTSIADNAFENCTKLTNLTISRHVVSISAQAFKNCPNLAVFTVDSKNSLFKTDKNKSCLLSGPTLVLGGKNTTIPNSVEYIGEYAFCGRKGIKTITIPDDTVIHSYAFYDCKDLTSVIYNYNIYDYKDYIVAVVDDYAFSNCPNLQTFSFKGYSVEQRTDEKGVYVGSHAFENCKKLNIVNFDALQIYSIEDYAFHNCSSLKSVKLNTKDFSWDPYEEDWKLIGDYAFSNCTGLTDFSTTNGVSGELGNHAFDGCTSLSVVTIPNIVTIEDYAFNNCKSLKDISLTSCYKLGKNAFNNCSSLTNVAFCVPDITVDENVFAGCTAIKYIFYNSDEYDLNCAKINQDVLKQIKTLNIHYDMKWHNYKVLKTVKPTYISLGTTLYECTVCGARFKAFKAPTGKLTLKHSARTANAIKVQWNNVNTATGYQVQISTKDGKKWSTYATLKAGVTSYTFKSLAAGNNYKFRVRFYIKADDGKNYFSPWSATLNSPTLPVGTTLTELTPAKKAFTARWKKQAVSGYQVQYSLKANFAGAKTITVKNPKLLKATAAKLYAGKYYFVRIRTYKTITKANYFSAWSKTYKVKTK